MDFSEFLFTSYNANILFATLHMCCKYRMREALRRLRILTAPRTFQTCIVRRTNTESSRPVK